MPLLAAAVNPLAGLLVLAAQANTVHLQYGRRYRIDGEVVSRGSVDTKRLHQLLQLIGAEDVHISERAPHRVQCTITMKAEFTIGLGSVLPLTLEMGIRIHSATPVPGSSATV